eukprot:scaffold1845_cov174-Amphora_coffeaeformis.AAC.6
MEETSLQSALIIIIIIRCYQKYTFGILSRIHRSGHRQNVATTWPGSSPKPNNDIDTVDHEILALTVRCEPSIDNFFRATAVSNVNVLASWQTMSDETLGQDVRGAGGGTSEKWKLRGEGCGSRR